MPLNILLADDSVPAQNMGKKILIDAGYAVVTVSNGLEALRKINETKPDIAILDIFMPGYSGLELCERLRSKHDTATLPVILTVGKMEPYRPQDGEHVHSNAVIIKPFAATELISAVRSLIGAPEVAEEAAPAAASGRPDAAMADPLEEHLETNAVSPEAQSVASPLEVPAFALQNQEDEPLFSDSAFADPEIAAPEPEAAAPPELSVDGATALPSLELSRKSDGPESLVFNPDAAHTPFSASVADLLPAGLSEENKTRAFSEFDLEPEATTYSANPNPELAAMGAESPDAGHAAMQEEEVASAPGAAVEASPLDTISPDPLLELPETAAWASAPEIHAEAVDTADVQASFGADQATSPQAQLSPEDEARRLAFEALFNSTEPFPEDDTTALSAVGDSVLLPSMADLSKEHPFEVEADSEIEHLADRLHGEFELPEPDPYLMEEEEPLHAVGAIPDRDPLLDDGSADDLPEAESTLQPEAAATIPSSGMYSPHLDEQSERMVELPPEIAAAEEPLTFAADDSEAPQKESEPAYSAGAGLDPAFASEPMEVPGAFAAEPLAESAAAAPASSSAATEPFPAAPEPLYPEPEAAQVVLLPQHESPWVEPEAPQPTPESAHSESALRSEPEALPAALAAHAVSAFPALEQPWPASSAASTEVRKTEAQQNEVRAVSSAPEAAFRSNEAERIHQAVERVFDRFKPLLVAAIVRELARSD